MRVTETELEGVLVLEPKVFHDLRGSFAVAWQRDAYRDVGIDAEFVQDNVSVSQRGVLRGLHFQKPRPQGKLVSVLHGAVWDVAVDLRRESRTFRKWVGVELSAENMKQLWIPVGLAHGFTVLRGVAVVGYKCSEIYVPQHDRGLRWNDPEIGVEWGIREPILSHKDREAPLLTEIALEDLF
jgi:dTDP-4-dehydrorhamnose 3,5-epimerase